MWEVEWRDKIAEEEAISLELESYLIERHEKEFMSLK